MRLKKSVDLERFEGVYEVQFIAVKNDAIVLSSMYSKDEMINGTMQEEIVDYVSKIINDNKILANNPNYKGVECYILINGVRVSSIEKELGIVC